MIDLLAVARGDKLADLVLRGGRIANVFTGEIERADIAIFDGRIAGIGAGYDGREVVDLRGATVAPGLIDAHVHIESSLCIPQQFAAALVPHGVTSAVVDPHEVANVAGVAGIRYMAESSRNLPLDAIFMAPSSVPATDLQAGGAALDSDDLAELLADGYVHGLAEVMNYPGVVAGDPEVLRKIDIFRGRPVDGHAPGLSGHFLNAYVAAGVGSDHECTTVEEAREKLARGLYILIREATNARNLHTLLPLITAAQLAPHLFLHRRSHSVRPARPGLGRLHGARGHCLTALIPWMRCAWPRSTHPNGLACPIAEPLRLAAWRTW